MGHPGLHHTCMYKLKNIHWSEYFLKFFTADLDTPLTQQSPFYPHSRLLKPKLTIHTPLTIGVSFRQSWWISRYIENIHFVTTKRSVPWLHFNLVQTCSACDSRSNLHALSDHTFPSCSTLDELSDHTTLSNHSSWNSKNTMILPRQLCVLCAPTFVTGAALIFSWAKRVICWVCPILVHDAVAPWRRFTAGWEHVIFDRHIAWHMSSFCFSREAIPWNC